MILKVVDSEPPTAEPPTAWFSLTPNPQPTNPRPQTHYLKCFICFWQILVIVMAFVPKLRKYINQAFIVRIFASGPNSCQNPSKHIIPAYQPPDFYLFFWALKWNEKSTKNRPNMNQKSVKNELNIDQKSSKIEHLGDQNKGTPLARFLGRF